MLNRWARTTKSARSKTCLALLGGLVVVGGAYAAAERGERKPELPAPSITAKPSKHSRETWVSFSFKDRRRNITFRCSLDGSRYKACRSPKRYPGPLTKGPHNFRVRVRSSTRKRALDSPASYTWRVERLSPTPYITRHLITDPRGSTSATFRFGDRQSHASFRCRLDDRAWSRCSSPIHYRRLRPVGHHFYVYVHAKGPSDIRSRVARFDWNAVAPVNSESFSISAGVIGSLFPGAAPLSIPLTLRNPNDIPIYVTDLTVAVTNSPTGCNSSTNVSLAQSSASSTSPVLIQANSSITLPAQGVSAPTIKLLDLPVSQDACRNATFPLSFTGSAHS